MPVLIDFEAIKLACTMQMVLDAYDIQTFRNKKAKCPFHADDHPSMHVYENGYYCFACGCGGDVINFIARMDDLTNAQAARKAAEIAGVDLPQSSDYRAREKARRAAAARRKRRSETDMLKSAYAAACSRRQRLVSIMMDGVPYSDDWCRAARELPGVEGELDELFEKLG